MPDFRYYATDASGRERTGLVRTDAEDLARAALEERGFQIVELYEESPPSLLERSIRIGRGVPLRDLVVFYRQLSLMVSANVALVEALREVASGAARPALREAANEVADDVESGGRLSDALRARDTLFTPFVVNMIRSGERSGQLAEVLEYLADEQEKDFELTSRVRGALAYPAFIVVGLVAVGLVVLVWVVPKLTELITETQTVLPLPTRLLIGVSGFAARFWWLLLVLAVGGAVALRVASQTRNGRYLLHAILLRVPIMGGLFSKIATVRFARSLETLLSGGVDLPGALVTAHDVVGNAVFEEAIFRAREEVSDGRPLAASLRESGAFPALVTQLIAVGETTGTLRQVLGRIASFTTKEVDRTVGSLVSLIEPIVILILGVAVGGMVAAVILPMYSIATQF